VNKPPKKNMNRITARNITAGLSAVFLTAALTASAADGKWNADASDNWSTASRWTNSQIADGVGAVANFSFNITAARTVTLNGARTVGRIRFNDDTTSSHDWTFAASGGNALKLEVASGSPTIDAGNRTVNFNAPFTGSQGFTMIGTSTLILNTSSNNFAGKVALNGGTTRFLNRYTIGAEPETYEADAITLNSGTLMNHNPNELVIGPTRGITLGATHGFLMAGWSSPVTINSVITGVGNLTLKSDVTPGPISLNAENTYTGRTIIGNSTAANSWCFALINGSTHADSVVSVTPNGSLGGTGVVNGPVGVVANGMIGPGGIFQAGTLTVNNAVAVTNGLLIVDLANVTTEGANVNDLLQVNGDLTLKGTITVRVNALAGSLTAGTYRLVNYTGNGDFADSTLVCDNPRLGATFDTSTPGQINMTIANGTPVNLVWTGVEELGGYSYWDIAHTKNFLNGGTPDVFYQGDAVTFDDSGSYAFPVTLFAGGPNMGMVQPSAVVVNSSKNITLTSLGSARLGGSMGIFKGGTGSLSLSLANNNNPNLYEGPTVVTNGTLKVISSRALGSTTGPTVIAGTGTLDVNALDISAEPIVVEGAGMNGLGAIVNYAGGNNNALRMVTMTGDTTVGGTGRFDIRNLAGPAYLSTGGQPFKLIKKGVNQFSLVGVEVDPALAEVEVEQGTFGFETFSTLGDASKAMTIQAGASLRLWSVQNDFYKPLILNGGIVDNGSNTNRISAPVTMTADSGWNIGGTSLAVYGNISGVGGLTKTGASPLYLYGVNTYTGPTFVSAGNLILDAPSAITNSSAIVLASGTTLDVSAISTAAGAFKLNGVVGQTLTGSGTIIGNVEAAPATTIIPGTSAGTLTHTGDLKIDGATVVVELGADTTIGGGVNDLIAVTGNLTLSGTITLRIDAMAALDTVNPYTIATYTGAFDAATATINVVTDSRYTFTLDPISAPGSIRVIAVPVATGAETLTWKGNVSGSEGLWDIKTTANWANSLNLPDTFFEGDVVKFDDTAEGTGVHLVAPVSPASVIVNNDTKTFAWTGPGKLTGTAGITKEGPGKLTIANTGINDNSGQTTITAGTLEIGNGGATGNLNNAPIANAGTLAFNRSDDITVANVISGSGTLEKQGIGMMTLSAANPGLAGPVVVASGVLRPGSAFSLGDPAAVLTVNEGASFDVNGFNFTNKVVRVSGAGQAGTGAIKNTSSTIGNWNTMNITLTGDTTFGGPTVWDLRGQSTTVRASLSTEGNPYKLTKIGAQRFSIVNTDVDPALGDIDIQEGIFSYEESTTGLGDPSKTITVRPGAFLTLYRPPVPVNKQVVLENGANLRGANSTTNEVSGPVTLAGGSANFAAPSGVTLSVTGPIGGPGGITKLEAGSVHLVASNWFEGDLDVNLGDLVLSNSYAAGTDKNVALSYNTTVTGGSGPRVFLRGGISTPEDVTGVFTALSTPADYRCSFVSDVLPNTWAGPILLNGSGIVGFYRNNAGAELNITGPIIGTNGFTGTAFFRGTAGYGGLISGKLELPTGIAAITDNAAWLFSNPGNLWTLTRIAYGKFILGADNAACATANLELGQSGSSSGTLDLNGFNQTVPAIATINGANHWITNGSETADSVFTFDGGANVSTLNGRIVDGTRKLSLTVNSGSLTLLGDNTYKGDTLISGGTLALGSAGTLAATPLIALASGATLDTSAKGAAGLTLASGQTLNAAGNIVGSLTVAPGATLTINGGSSAAIIIVDGLALSDALSLAGTTAVDVNSGATPASDVITAASVTFGGTLAVNNLGPAFAAGNSFKLFDAAAYSGSFSEITPATPGDGLSWDTSMLAVDGTLKVKTAVSTEPPPIAFEVKPGSIDLSWPPTHLGWRLEAQTNSITTGISVNWVTVPDSSTTTSVSMPIDPANGTVFFRLVYP